MARSYAEKTLMFENGFVERETVADVEQRAWAESDKCEEYQSVYRFANKDLEKSKIKGPLFFDLDTDLSTRKQYHELKRQVRKLYNCFAEWKIGRKPGRAACKSAFAGQPYTALPRGQHTEDRKTSAHCPRGNVVAQQSEKEIQGQRYFSSNVSTCSAPRACAFCRYCRAFAISFFSPQAMPYTLWASASSGRRARRASRLVRHSLKRFTFNCRQASSKR